MRKNGSGQYDMIICVPYEKAKWMMDEAKRQNGIANPRSRKPLYVSHTQMSPSLCSQVYFHNLS